MTNNTDVKIPGLVDMQVNGYAGIDFNGEQLDYSGYIHAVKTLYQNGVTLALPTIITNSAEYISGRLRLLESYRDKALQESFSTELCKTDYYHLEGPFISSAEGYRGAHPLEFVLPLNLSNVQSAVSEWIRASNNRIKIITLCCRGCAEDKSKQQAIRFIVDSGIHVSLGHTNANADDITAAVESGADLATHLGNACAQLLPRHENPIWPILAEKRLWISMIADGYHLPKEMLQVFRQVKGDKAILVSDATQFTGLKPGCYRTHIGGDVVLTPQGKLHLAGQPGVLAGAACGLDIDFENAIRFDLGTREQCRAMASTVPMSFLGVDAQDYLHVNNNSI